MSRALESPELQVMAMGLIDTIGGRMAGVPAGTRAEAWAARWLRSFGMDSVWYEPVSIPVWRRGAATVRVATPALLRQRRITAAAYAYTPSFSDDSLPVVDIGRGSAATLDSIGANLNGAALLTDGVIGPELLAKAIENGAAALLRISFEPGRLPQARVAPTQEPPVPLTILSLAREDGLWLRRQVAAGPLALAIRVDAETQMGTSLNVVGEWWGSDAAVREEVFLLGAHLDAWDLGDGAIDNGTGVLTVMTAVQALTAGDVRPRRTVRVVLFTAEELGLLGSRRYVEAHADKLSRLVAMMNLDMVGRPQAFGATGHTEADSLFGRLAEALQGLGLAGEVNHGGGPGSDHQPFLLVGVPTIYVQTALPPDAPLWYHNAGDTLDKVDLDAVRASAAAVAAAAWALADHPGRPLRHLSAQETRQLVQRLGW